MSREKGIPRSAATEIVILTLLCLCLCFFYVQAGLAFDSLQQCFRKVDVNVMFETLALPLQINQQIWIVVDPAAGGLKFAQCLLFCVIFTDLYLFQVHRVTMQ